MLISCFENNYSFDPIRFLDFSNYNISENVRLAWGLNSIKIKRLNNYINIAIYFEEPNFLYYHNLFDYSENYDIKLTLCKFSSIYFNKTYKNENKKSYYVFFPIDTIIIKKYIWDKYKYNLGVSIPYWKNINVMYIGNDVSDLTKNFKYRVEKYNNCYIDIPTYFSKMEILLHTKIAIVHNLLFLNEINNENIYVIPEFKDKKIIPQLKSRTFEAAFSQCIILCYKDEYNIIEDYFKPNEDFIYFETLEQLDILIQNILSNYEKYSYISQNAYYKFINNYTLKHFCDKYINIY